MAAAAPLHSWRPERQVPGTAGGAGHPEAGRRERAGSHAGVSGKSEAAGWRQLSVTQLHAARRRRGSGAAPSSVAAAPVCPRPPRQPRTPTPLPPPAQPLPPAARPQPPRETPPPISTWCGGASGNPPSLTLGLLSSASRRDSVACTLGFSFREPQYLFPSLFLWAGADVQSQHPSPLLPLGGPEPPFSRVRGGIYGTVGGERRAWGSLPPLTPLGLHNYFPSARPARCNYRAWPGARYL